MNTSLKIIAMTIFSLSCELVQLVLKIHNQLYALIHRYCAFHILPQIYTANHATFLIQIYAITV